MIKVLNKVETGELISKNPINNIKPHRIVGKKFSEPSNGQAGEYKETRSSIAANSTKSRKCRNTSTTWFNEPNDC